MSGNSVIIFFTAILLVAFAVLIVIKFAGKRSHKFNKEEYQTRFLAIGNRLTKENPATFVVTIIEADKLLDHAMIEMKVPGRTMGDRMKRIGDKFSDVNSVWRAHKLRNVIAHETDTEVTYRQAATALSIYKQALKDLGAI